MRIVPFPVVMLVLLSAACSSSTSSSGDVAEAGVHPPKADAGSSAKDASGDTGTLPASCGPKTPCPDHFACVQNTALKLVCEACTGTAASEGVSCVCAADCAGGLVCSESRCQRGCTTDAECGAGNQCIPHLTGSNTCAPIPAGCAAKGTAQVGEACSCNADCAGATPSCLNVTVGSTNAGSYCIKRPCDVTSSSSCSPGAAAGARCCSIEPVVAPTCFNGQLASGLSSMGTCSP